MSTSPSIVLVHGAWADGSCWSAVIERLQADGYDVTAPSSPRRRFQTTSHGCATYLVFRVARRSSLGTPMAVRS